MQDTDLLGTIWQAYEGYGEAATPEEIRALYNCLQNADALYNERPALLLAAAYADAAAVQLLLEKGADATAETHNGETALHTLARRESRQYTYPAGAVRRCAEVLLAGGVSPLRKNTDGFTCATIAAENGNHELLEALAASGKKMDLPNANGDTPLHVACQYANHAASSFFTYAEPRYKEAMAQSDPADETALLILEMRRQSARETYERERARVEAYFLCVQALLAAGLDAGAKNGASETPKTIAFACKDLRIPALLAGEAAAALQLGGTATAAQRAKGMNLVQAVDAAPFAVAEHLLIDELAFLQAHPISAL